MAFLSAAMALGAVAATGVANVRDFGAKGDGKTDDTAAIRQALEAVPLHGGVVYFPAGHYVSATITGRRNVTFDRNFGPGIDISLPSARSASSALVINGNTFRRNGYLRDDEPEASVHLRLRNVKGVSATGNSFHGDAHPQDARKGRTASPINGILLEGLVDSVVANNSLFHAAQKTLIIDQGGHQNTTIRDNPGSPALPSPGKAGPVKP